MVHRDKESYSIQSVENALDVLVVLSEEGEVRISQLSERLGLNKTSVFRLLATFENRGYVERENDSGKYRLGLAAYEMGQKFLLRMGLLRKARPVMERLSQECGESVYLTVRRGDDVLFLDLVDTPQQIKIAPLLGRRFPLADSSVGQAFIAHGDNGFSGGTEAIDKLRRYGAAYDVGGLGEGVTCAAVPLFAANSEVVGALALVGPAFRLSPARLEGTLLARLREAGEVVSCRLGHSGGQRYGGP